MFLPSHSFGQGAAMTAGPRIRFLFARMSRLRRDLLTPRIRLSPAGTQPDPINLSVSLRILPVSLRIGDSRCALHRVGCGIEERDAGPDHALHTLHCRQRRKARHGVWIIEVPLTFGDTDKITNRRIS